MCVMYISDIKSTKEIKIIEQLQYKLFIILYIYVCIVKLLIYINLLCIHRYIEHIDLSFYSSGVLIILPASGNGTFHARFDDVRALVKGLVSTKIRDDKTYLNVEKLDVELGVKNVNMRVRKIYRNNRILSTYSNHP